MKKLLIATAAMFTICFAAQAQEKRMMKDKHHQHKKMDVAKKLNLSAAQKNQLKANQADYKKQMAALNKNENITVKEFRDKKAALHLAQKAKMQNLLTAEQKQQLATAKGDKKVKAKQHYEARLSKMQTNLNLTNQQVAALKTQHEEMGAKMKALKEDDAMDRLDKKEKLAALKLQAKEAHKNIFTAEQLKKMEEMKQNHKKAVK